MSDRLACIVPFCRRTTRRQKDWQEWICTKHWRLVSRRLKLLRSAARRRRRPTALYDVWLWRECKRQAQERALSALDL